jgi:hypothetical protein
MSVAIALDMAMTIATAIPMHSVVPVAERLWYSCSPEELL